MIGKMHIPQVSKNKIRRGQLIFYVCMISLPLLQFLIFYIGINFNSILLAFKQYDVYTNTFSFAGFANFLKVFQDLKQTLYLQSALKNSTIVYLLGLFISTPLTLLFSFYLFKKMPFSGVMKIVLFLPTMLSSLIVILIFKYFMDRALPGILEALFKVEVIGFLSTAKTARITLFFFAVWSSFGSSILLYLGAMNSTSESLYEAAKMDGAGLFSEFWHITLPQVFPTLSVYLITGIGGFFTNQMGLFSFYGTEAEYELYTLGYFLYRGIKTASISDYPYYSAMGLLMTVIAIPVTYGVRYLLNRFGPSDK